MPSEYKFEAQNLSRVFGQGQRAVKAVDDVSFAIKARDIIALVGESGCGKTVLAKMLLRLDEPTSGRLIFEGRDIAIQRSKRVHWQKVQAVFQDPFSAFNQFFTIRSQLKKSFRLLEQRPSNSEMEDRIDEALLNVNIEPQELEGKYPFELSGGQMQRMLLARIFILRPEVLVADEPTSMVDACSRAAILEYLLKLKAELEMTIVLVTHDIGLACHVADSIFIMDQGRIAEQGPPGEVTQSPQSPVTRRLLDDIPHVNRDWLKRSGKSPALA